MDELYKDHVINLFSKPFYDIKKDTKYNWNEFKNIFLYLFKQIYTNLNNKEQFIKFYYLTIIIYIYYTNYLKFIKSKDFYNPEIYHYIRSLQTKKDISKKLFEYSYDQNVSCIIKYINPFIYTKITKINKNPKKHKQIEDSVLDNLTNNLLDIIKKVDKFLSYSNKESKKIISIIIYRFLSSRENGFNSYHNFYLKNNHSHFYSSEYFFNFLQNIPKQKNILNIKTENFVNRKNIHALSIIKYLLTIYDNFYIIKEESHKRKITLTNKKQEIIEEKTIIISNKLTNNYNIHIKLNTHCDSFFVEYDLHQYNLNLLYYENKNISDVFFINNSDFFITINTVSDILNDPSDILDFFHYLILSFKTIDNYPSNISKLISPLNYSNYYYDSFFHFINFFKNDISSDSFVGKFIIDLFKFLYIYSYYDYYIYYKNDLSELIVTNIDKKEEIFSHFYINFKNTLKLGKDIIPFPPFCDIDDDINRIIYYSFEIPSYFKLFDLSRSFVDVYNFNDKENITPLTILTFIHELKNNKILSSNKISYSKNSYNEVIDDNNNNIFLTDA